MADTSLSNLRLLSAEAVRKATKCPRCLPSLKFREVSKFPTRKILSGNSSASKKNSYKIMRMKIFATKDKAKPQQRECKSEIWWRSDL